MSTLKKYMCCETSTSEDVFIKSMFSHLTDAKKKVGKIVLLGDFKMTVININEILCTCD